jgi:sigma-54-like protein
MINRIHIEQLEIHVRVGVADSERAQPQRLILNATFWPNRAGPRRHGIPIAHRTVAKYRTELNILPSNMRRKY